MRPLDPLVQGDEASPIESLLRGAPPEAVRAEVERLDALDLDGLQAAARSYARGALDLRTGRLEPAAAALGEAAEAFEAAGEGEAAALAAAERWLAKIRRGPRQVYDEAADALERLAKAQRGSKTVQVVATHYRATALRQAGQAEATLRVLLEAFAQSEGLYAERAQVLNSLGTLYVVLGAYGAAEAVLAHAADLNHQIGDRVSEAISYGQLGSAAMARGDLAGARRSLQRQEWLAGQVGDPFGRARALVLLGDLALDLGQPDVAAELAGQGRDVACCVEPPLEIWVSYATRSLGRAKLELGERAAAIRDLREARTRFRRIGNQLGEALCAWDLGRARATSKVLQAQGPRGRASGRWHDIAWRFATLGLTARVAQVLRDVRALVATPAERAAVDLALAAVAQPYPHLASAQEVDLVLTEPDTVARMANRRIVGQRNLGRLAALTLAPPGLFVAAVAGGAIGAGVRAVPNRKSAAALVGQIPGVACWAWGAGTSPTVLARDLSALRVAVGEDSRAVVGWFPEARLVEAPFAGELGGELVGADAGAMIATALAGKPGSVHRLPGLGWDGEAEALLRMSGFASDWAGPVRMSGRPPDSRIPGGTAS
jgi:tetratricopeptide (TPR) repeat protein